MCKLFIMTNTAKIKNIVTASKTIHSHITKSERDGFGYMVVGEKGIFGERSIQKSFESRLFTKKSIINLPIVEPTTNTFGIVSKPIGAGVWHGRTSTNDLNIVNTHPIRVEGWYLSHNGVVSNKGPAYKMTTTNDTEHLAHYMANGGIAAVESNLSGYYAFGAIDPAGRLHVVRDDNATLYMGFSSVLDSYMIATTVDLLEGIAKEMGAKLSHIEKMADNMYSLWDGNSIALFQDIEPLGVQRYESQYASKSLAYLGEGSYERSFAKVPYESKFNENGPAPSYHEASYEPSELDMVDESYCIYLDEREIDFLEFSKMDEMQQRQCVITRPDGTLIDMEDVA